jgi:hypothetical protein
MSELDFDKGGGRIRPLKNPTYAQVFALPDGTDIALIANIKPDEQEWNRDYEAGTYCSGHTVTPELRENWTSRLPVPPDEVRAADIMFYVLPEDLADDVTGDDSVLAADTIASRMLEEFMPRIFENANSGNPGEALELFRDLVTETVKQGRRGYVRKPF